SCGGHMLKYLLAKSCVDALYNAQYIPVPFAVLCTSARVCYSWFTQFYFGWIYDYGAYVLSMLSALYETLAVIDSYIVLAITPSSPKVVKAYERSNRAALAIIGKSI